MKTVNTIILSVIGAFCLATSIHASEFTAGIIDEIRIQEKDLPSNFMFGKIPRFARPVLKDNPWAMDQKAIRTLAGKIYPGGNYNHISGIHSTIIAEKQHPYGDDIVCYIILYRNSAASKDEQKKLKGYADMNPLRTLLLQKENLAVFMFVDDVKNFGRLREMEKIILERLEKASSSNK